MDLQFLLVGIVLGRALAYASMTASRRSNREIEWLKQQIFGRKKK